MVTEGQIAQYSTFGFLVLPAALDAAALGELIEEVDAAVAAAGPRDTAGGGITGHYIPAGGRQASEALVRRFHPVAERLLGREAFPVAAHEVLYFAEAWWHVDVGPDVPSLKVALYLETLDARNGALRVLPGTHLIPQGRLAAIHAMNPHHVPCHVVETTPGDAIVFAGHLWHAALNGRDRRQWSVEYHAFPADERERRELARLCPEWREEPAWGPMRVEDAARLVESGVLEPGATIRGVDDG